MKKVIRSFFLLSVLIGSIILGQVQTANAIAYEAQINMEFSETGILVGDTTILTISIFNQNYFILDNVSFTNSLAGRQPGLKIGPGGLLSNSCSGIVIATPGTTTISLSGGTVPANTGVQGSCQIQVEIITTTSGNLLNTIPAYGVEPSYGGVGLYATARGGLDIITNSTRGATTVTLLVLPVTSPTMNKSFSPSTVWAGESTQLEINLFNEDTTNTLTGVTYTDNLPSPFVVSAPLTTSLLNCGIGATLTASVGSSSVTLNNGTISPRTTCRVRVRVVSSTQGAYTNTIPSGSVQTNQLVTNNTNVTAPVNVQSVKITKTFNPTSFAQGDTSTLTIRLQNPSSTVYSNVNLNDVLPGPLVVSGTPVVSQCNGTISVSGDKKTISLTNGSIPAGNTITPGSCNIVVQVTSPTYGGPYTNNIPAGTALGPVTTMFDATAQATVTQRTIKVAKVFGADFVENATTSLTITLSNETTSAFTGVTFTDTMPAGITIVGTPTANGNCGTGAVVTSSSNSITLTNGVVPAGSVASPGTCVVSATVTSSTSGSGGTTYTNRIEAGDVCSVQGICNAAAASDAVIVYPLNGGATVSKTFDGSATKTILAGSSSLLTITIRAPRDTSLSQIHLRDNFPDDMVLVSAPSTTCGGTLSGGIGSQFVELTGGSIATANSTCTITANVTSYTPGSHINTILANSLSTYEGRTDSTARSATLAVTSFQMSKDFAPNAIAQGGLSQLTIYLSNSNLQPVTGVTLSDNLASMDQGTYAVRVYAPSSNPEYAPTTDCTGGNLSSITDGGSTISISGATIPASDGVVDGLCRINVYVIGQSTSVTPVTRTNTIATANVSGTVQGQLVHPIAAASDTLTIQPLDINVDMGFNPVGVYNGSYSVLTIDLINLNAVPLSGIKFTDVMPVGMILANPVNFNVGTCGGTLTGTAGSNSFSFSGGSLPASSTCHLKLNVTMTVSNNLLNEIPAQAVTSFEGAKNSAGTTETLSNAVGAFISKSFSPNPVSMGNYSLLTITITNVNSEIPLTSVGLVDTFPTGMTVADTLLPAPVPVNNCGGSLTAVVGANSIELSGGSLGASSSCTLVIPVVGAAAGSYTNTIPAGRLTTFQGVSNTEDASDTLVVSSFSLGNRVWDDNGSGGGTAKDGLQNGTEPGINGVTVNLYADMDDNGTPDGSVIATQTTDSNGYYRFDALASGTYIVEVGLPTGYSVTAINGGDPDSSSVDMDNNGTNASIPGFVRSSPVTLEPTAIEPTNDNDPVTNPALTGEGPNNQSNRTVDFGLYLPFSLGNRVWNDNGAGSGTAGDGLQNGTEPGISGVTVRLYRDTDKNNTPDGSAIDVMVTDVDGYYRFDNLYSDSYIVEVVTPSGYGVTSGAVSDPNSDLDLDNNGANVIGVLVRSQYVTLGLGANEPTLESNPALNPETGEASDNQSNRTLDFGFIGAYSVGNRIWDDNGAGTGGSANDGIKNGTEPGMSGVLVRLYSNLNPAVVIASTTSDASGYYRFDSLAPGEYIVEAKVATGYANSTGKFADTITDLQNKGSDTLTNPGYVRSIVVTLGENMPINDNDPVTNPVTGEAANASSNRTMDFGFYHQPYTLGNLVWLDNGAGGGGNNNGLHDGTEPGIANLIVKLYRASDTLHAISTTETDANGNYQFTLLPSDDYLVKVTIPTGYIVSSVNNSTDPTDVIDDDNNGTDLSGTLLSSKTITLTLDNNSIDFGLTQLPSLGDYVWNDLDRDGVQDAGEPGVTGVTVKLYQGVLGSGTQVGSNGTTGAGGYYLFSNLTPANDYYLEFTLPTGYSFSPTGAGTSTTDNDATLVSGSTGRTGLITLVSNTNDLSWDAGIYQPPASIGNTVWNDNGASGGTARNGIMDGGETGVAGVTVELFRPGYGLDGIAATSDDNLPVKTTLTNGSGNYLFDELGPGNYFATFTLPSGYAFAPKSGVSNVDLDSDADIVTGQTALTTIAVGENDLTWDAGLYQLASIGDFVWNDLNHNGIQDGGSELGMSGVLVNLYDSTNTIIATTTTTGTGGYLFGELQPGDYYVGFIPPVGYAFTQKNALGSTVNNDSDADLSTGKTVLTTLDIGENDLSWDTGLYFTASIGDKVWNDNGLGTGGIKRNGVQDGTEPGIAGVTVTLYDSSDNLVSSTSTSSSGIYGFTGLVPGDYYVTFELPAGYQFSPANFGSDDTIDSDVSSVTLSIGKTIVTTLDPGENDPTWDAGMYLQPASLGDFVWFDENGNGVQDVGEAGVNGIEVKLYNASATLLDQTTTANIGGIDGKYLFSGLSPDYYSLVFSAPGYLFSLTNQGGNANLDSDAIIPGGQTNLTLLDPGENDLSWDAGLYNKASLGNKVWMDTNADGIQDAGESGINGVKVDLYRVGAGFVATANTSGGGLYSFTDLVPGDYYLIFTLPSSGYFFSPQSVGADTEVDSDADQTTGQTPTITLSSSENDLSWDAGMYQKTSIGNLIWLDVNGNGLQDGGSETGINGVTVDLYTGANEGTYVRSVDTAGGGLYSFTDLVPGEYHVVIHPPVSYLISPLNMGADDAVDSDADRSSGRMANTILTTNENDMTWDAGLYQPASLGDYVWVDTNGNGIQDSGEPDLANVLVELYRPGFGADGVAGTSDDNAIVSSTSTDSDGAYLFYNLIPGDYYLIFTKPSGYLISPADFGADGVDSDAANDGKTVTTTLTSGETDYTWDAGMYLPASLGNLAWIDSNGDGIQDSSESGANGVTVNLYRPGFGPDGIPGTTGDNDSAVTSTVTAAVLGVNGIYGFTGLIPGTYFIDFIPPVGLSFAPDNQGADDELDSDPSPATGSTITTTLASGEEQLYWDAGFNTALASLGNLVWLDNDGNGIQNGGEPGINGVSVKLFTSTGTTPILTRTTSNGGYYSFTDLQPGAYILEFDPPVGYSFSTANLGGNDATDSDANPATHRTSIIDLGVGEHDITWDAGLSNTKASFGNFVWLDINANNLQDTGELGIDGVTVDLYTSTDVKLLTTNTSGGGYYSFTGLTPGDYYAIFTLPNAGYYFSQANVTANDAIDSDGNQVTGQTPITTLSAGEEDLTVDQGLILFAKIGLAKRQIGEPVSVSIGTWDVTFEFLVKNYGTSDLFNVQVEDNLRDTFPADSSFTIQSISSSDFTVNNSYNGDTNVQLLEGSDTLGVENPGTITVVVRVIPDRANFLNSATATGEDEHQNVATDESDDGSDPDGEVVKDDDPSDDNDKTPVYFGAKIFDPPFGIKTVNDSGQPELKWTMVWINNTNIVGVHAVVHDPIPEMTTFTPNLVDSGYGIPDTSPDGSTSFGVSCTSSSETVTELCYYEGPTPAYPRGQIIWEGILGPDLGALEPVDAKNAISITFTVTVNGSTVVKNNAFIDSDLNGDGDAEDVGERSVALADFIWDVTPEDLPDTGFAPNQVTLLPKQTTLYNELGDFWLEIPKLDIKMPIVGVPMVDNSWDVSWLGNMAGWLDETAYPTTAGNSVITGHVYLPNGKPGPFVNLVKMGWNDKIIIHVAEKQYIYRVRQVKRVYPDDLSPLNNESSSWITLVTCQSYDEKSDNYLYRQVVKAVLIEIK
ncbi:MAG: hypothetical protein C0410_02025 [Anaerolinea sp.]|nr:hypothetical protein [Anaerolinea sp.]